MTDGPEAGNDTELGEDSLEIDTLQPQYVQLTNYWEEERNINQILQNRDEADLEATLLGYDLSQEISGIDRNLRYTYKEQGLGLEEDPDYGQDYHLGEIGNRSFCDIYVFGHMAHSCFLPRARKGSGNLRGRRNYKTERGRRLT